MKRPHTPLVVALCGGLVSLSALLIGLSVHAAGQQREFTELVQVQDAPTPATGMTATWYGERYCGRKTASGFIFDCQSFTAAHKTLPFGTKLQVEHGGRKVQVVVTDRGPFGEGRDLDLSAASFAALAPLSRGVIRVAVRRVEP